MRFGFNQICLLTVCTLVLGRTSGADRTERTDMTGRMADSCLMGSVCKNKLDGVTRNSPCHLKRAPLPNVTDDDFYDLLWTHCPHFFDDSGELSHPICCSAEQEDSISKLINQVDIIRRSCPSCTLNAKKYFCNLFCLPNQSEIVNIEKINGEAVVNITYIVSKQFAQTFYQSCYDVKIFGAYLMDQEYICGKHKRQNCDLNKFLTTLGSIAQMPLVVTPLITDEVSVTIGEKKFKPMVGKVYECFEAPPEENKCSCDNCMKTCKDAASHQMEKHSHESVNSVKHDPNHKNGVINFNQISDSAQTIMSLLFSVYCIFYFT